MLLILNFALCNIQQTSRHTLHYIYWNFDTPTSCPALYSTVHFKKQILVVLKFQLGLSKSHSVFKSRNQKEPLLWNLNYSLTHLSSRSRTHFRTHVLLILNLAHFSLYNTQQASIYISLLELKLWHSYTMPCFVFHRSLRILNICYTEISTWPFKD